MQQIEDEGILLQGDICILNKTNNNHSSNITIEKLENSDVFAIYLRT